MGNMTMILLFLLSLCSALQSPVLAERRSYIVYLGTSGQLDLDKTTDSYHELLGSCMKSKNKAKEAIFYSYPKHIKGFAAILEDEEAAEISKRPEVLSVFVNEVSELQTTRSWEFLGLERNGEITADSIWVKGRFGEDAIIGALDTGVWPESKSFNDKGMGPVPPKWKGYCETNDGVLCNRKLIGARYFNKGYEAAIGRRLNSSFNTARDTDGHGTHVLSTLGGRFVAGANLFGSGYGTAKGGSPDARVASYKVCWPSCTDADILAAFEAAIEDGVDVISVSLEGRPRDYFSQAIAIGSFHAVKNGILVVCAAGNSGPTPGRVSNVAPWILTVGASTIDREFSSNVILGNNKQFKGVSYLTNTQPARKFYPLIYSLNAKAANVSDLRAELCLVGSLDPKKIKGKIVYCLHDHGIRIELVKSLAVAEAGGVGVIIGNLLNPFPHTPEPKPEPEPHFLPTSHVSAADGLSIVSYINTTKLPVAYISGKTEVGAAITAPIMASFSSPGPNTITPEILKPDITAPGVSILAAYTEATGPSSLPPDNRHLPFNIISGTSMSCPHISGIAGLLKTMHPHWSPAAIRSAIMTTATTSDNMRQPIANATLAEASPFNYGAGHISPNGAMDPGLVYDLTTRDYLNFLCTIGYNETKLSKFVSEPYKCPLTTSSLNDFNYPSITVPNLLGKTTVSRILKNVGSAGIYRVHINAPDGIVVNVEPQSLEFNKINEEREFKVTLEEKVGGGDGGMYVFGRIVWSDGKHSVRSPVVVKVAKKM